MPSSRRLHILILFRSGYAVVLRRSAGPVSTKSNPHFVARRCGQWAQVPLVQQKVPSSASACGILCGHPMIAARSAANQAAASASTVVSGMSAYGGVEFGLPCLLSIPPSVPAAWLPIRHSTQPVAAPRRLSRPNDMRPRASATVRVPTAVFLGKGVVRLARPDLPASFRSSKSRPIACHTRVKVRTPRSAPRSSGCPGRSISAARLD